MLIQINEAHSDKWPIGMGDHPTVQKSLADRIQRARDFIDNNILDSKQEQYMVYIDKWTDDYENTYHAWPDQYILIECSTGKILDRSKYDVDARIMNDYGQLLAGLDTVKSS